MGLFSKKNSAGTKISAAAVQTGSFTRHPFGRVGLFTPMGTGGRVYASLRESVPIIDAAVLKIIRLVNDFKVATGDDAVDRDLNGFFESINVGGNQIGIDAFVSAYLSDLLTYGSAVGEMIADENGFYALYNGELESIEVKRAANGFDIEFYNGSNKIARQDLILFTALNPKPGEITGTSLLSGLPFIADILLTIYNTIGENWEHAGNLRYAVTYKPGGDGGDSVSAQARAKQICSAWQEAMSSKDSVKDFVAVGDVSVKVIGADNNVLSSEIPVRQLTEQIIAKTGLPPYMLGLSWSTTERMSIRQADMLTTELKSYRKVITPVLIKIARQYLDLKSIWLPVNVEWADITLQDETEHAKARLYNAQADNAAAQNAANQKEVSD